MASIRKEITVDVPAATLWAAVRDVAHPHRLFAGVLTDSRLEGDVRVVDFANGMTVRELIVDLDDAERRFAYASVGGRARHHHATMQVLEEGASRCRFVWVTDVLPKEMAVPIEALMVQGLAALKRTIEAA